MKTEATRCCYCHKRMTEKFSAYPFKFEEEMCCKDCYEYKILPIITMSEKCHSDDPDERRIGELYFKIIEALIPDDDEEEYDEEEYNDEEDDEYMEDN